MKIIQNPWIKLKENVDEEDYALIQQFQEQCIQADSIALKLELDYKRRVAAENGKSKGHNLKNVNEFMYFDGQELVGYIGICHFGGAESPVEMNGMVHPEYRRQGIFNVLSRLAMAEWKRRNAASMLLLTDRKSIGGQGFIRTLGAQYHHSEYEMYLRRDPSKPVQATSDGITIRRATNEDAKEIARQNTIYFNDGSEEEIVILPETEEQRGMAIYIAEYNQRVIGKIHLSLLAGIGGIYGFGVLPEFRGKGFGRTILTMAVAQLLQDGANEVMLQVAADNANALQLYESCGFLATSTMDYYELTDLVTGD